MKALRERAARKGLPEDPVLSEALDDLARTLEALSAALAEVNTSNEELAHAHLAAVQDARRYESRFRLAPDAYVVTDAQGVIRELNRVAERQLGRARRYLIGKPMLSLVAPADGDTFLEYLAALRDRRISLQEQVIRFGADPGFDASISAVPQPLGNDLEIGWTLRDVTERRSAERASRAREMRAAEEARLEEGPIVSTARDEGIEKSLLRAATAAAEERERQRLAADLHDDVGQLLSLAGIKVGMLRNASGDAAAKLRDELADLVSRAHQRTESLTFQLSPPILRDMGLAAAVEWLADDIGKGYGLRVYVEHDGEPPLDEATRITVFRSVRELLINSARHGRTNSATVKLAREGNQLGVVIEDRGIGFDLGSRSPGFGLASVRERLESLGGRFEIESEVGGGTRAKLAIALASPRGLGARRGP